jgi:hypothetical protein
MPPCLWPQVDGFLLDRGFQIFLTGYPEAQVRARDSSSAPPTSGELQQVHPFSTTASESVLLACDHAISQREGLLSWTLCYC